MSRLHARALLLAALVLSAEAAHIPAYFRRDEVCGGSRSDNLSQCGKGLDDGLCCPSGTSCLSLAGGSTVLCCPGGSCNRLEPITCNTHAQDPDLFPNASLKTTALKAKLPKCGDNCCPFGFSCNDDEQCDMNEDQSDRPSELPDSALPSTTSIPSSAITEPSIIPTSSDSDSASSTPSPSPSSPSSSGTPSASAEGQQDDGIEDGQNFDADNLPGLTVAGIVIGCFLGVLVIGIAVCMCIRRRRRPKGSKRSTSWQASTHERKKNGDRPSLQRAPSSSSSFGNLISGPIPQNESALRTDFMLKGAEPAKQNRTSSYSQRLSSIFRRDTVSGGAGAGVGTGDSSPPPMSAQDGFGVAVTSGPRGSPRYPARTLSNATMNSRNPNDLGIPPIRTMRNQQKPTINAGAAASARAAITEETTPTEPTHGSAPMRPHRPTTPGHQREPSADSLGVNINVFADPNTVESSPASWASPGPRANVTPGDLAPPRLPRPLRTSSGTTFTDLMEEAQLGDVRRGDPYVPSTPGRRRNEF